MTCTSACPRLSQDISAGWIQPFPPFPPCVFWFLQSTVEFYFISSDFLVIISVLGNRIHAIRGTKLELYQNLFILLTLLLHCLYFSCFTELVSLKCWCLMYACLLNNNQIKIFSSLWIKGLRNEKYLSMEAETLLTNHCWTSSVSLFFFLLVDIAVKVLKTGNDYQKAEIMMMNNGRISYSENESEV